MTTKIIPLFTSGQIADFWSHVEKNDGCWIWKGSKSPRGYGYFNLKKQGWSAELVLCLTIWTGVILTVYSWLPMDWRVWP